MGLINARKQTTPPDSRDAILADLQACAEAINSDPDVVAAATRLRDASQAWSTVQTNEATCREALARIARRMIREDLTTQRDRLIAEIEKKTAAIANDRSTDQMARTRAVNRREHLARLKTELDQVESQIESEITRLISLALKRDFVAGATVPRDLRLSFREALAALEQAKAVKQSAWETQVDARAAFALAKDAAVARVWPKCPALRARCLKRFDAALEVARQENALLVRVVGGIVAMTGRNFDDFGWKEFDEPYTGCTPKLDGWRGIIADLMKQDPVVEPERIAG